MIFPAILLIVSACTHFYYFGFPSAVVFDEVYMGSFVSAYGTGAYYFDIHPPLAKLITAFFAYLIDAPSNADFGMIGNELPWGVILLRLMPILAGILLPLCIYYICRSLNFSKITAFAAGALIILENSLLTQSRFLLFDSVLLLFGFTSVLFYLWYTKNESRRFLIIGSAILAACAFSVKWTGLAYPLLILIAEIVRTKDWRHILKFFSKYALVGLIIYCVSFGIHFAYLTKSGPGDAFMTDRFQKGLIGNPHASDESLKPKGFFGKTIELNIRMLQANQTLTNTHPYASPWFTWPFLLRPVFYWEGTAVEGAKPYIYLLGNPLIYLLGTLSILFLVWRVLIPKKREMVSLFLLTGFLVNFLPFMFISRVMFIYHYEAALVFSIIAIAFLIEKYISQEKKLLAVSVLLVLSLIIFLYFTPLTYGFPLSDAALKARMWLPTWR